MKTKLLTIAALIAGLLGIQSVSALGHYDMSAMDGWYLSASASGSFHNDTDLGNDASCVDHDFGYGFNTAIGYILCDWSMRVEAEYIWHRWSNDCFKPVSGASVNDCGHIRRYAFMGNLLYDMELCDPFSMYIGGGIGYGNARLELDHTIGTKYCAVGDDWVFAWQLMAGLVYNLNDCWDITAGYRFFAMSKPSLPIAGSGNENVCRKLDDMPYSNHIDVGLRFKF